MAGVMAGTAILKGMQATGELRTVTLTINNSCNLNCPHCYLQYRHQDLLVKEPTITSLLNANFEHLAIVGKEPLVNKASISLITNLVEKVRNKGKTVSIITNGLGLNHLLTPICKELDYIDISFDGGPVSYSLYRRVPFEKIMTGVKSLKERSNVSINALHTISDFNIEQIEDMMRIEEWVSFRTIMFSAYLRTLNHGFNSVHEVTTSNILTSLAQSPRFMANKNAVFALDINNMSDEEVKQAVLQKIKREGLESKVILIKQDPLLFGIIRVSFDDLVMTPYESVNPALYAKNYPKASENDLNHLYRKMVATV